MGNRQLEELDAEIAQIESGMKPEPQVQAPGSVVPPVQPTTEEVELISSVEEFEGLEQPPGVAAVVAPLQTPQQAPAAKNWEEEYRTLENRYVKLRQSSDAFKFESRQQIAQLQEALASSQEANEALQMQVIELSQSTNQLNLIQHFSPEDVEVLGADTLNSFERAVKQAVDTATAPLKAELTTMKKAERDRLRAQSKLNQGQAYQSFETQLEQLVPGFRQINVDKNFIEWLRQPSPYTGVPRIDYFRKAEQVGDVERVAQYFVEFAQLQESSQQLLAQSVAPTGQGGGSAAPSTSVAQGQGGGKKVFTRQFINQFYDDDIAGKYRGREALRDKLDAEIDLALSEGRVLG